MDHGRIRQAGLLVNLRAGEVLRLRDAAGRHLTVVRGDLWITQLGERGDPVVAAGETFRFTRAGVSLAQLSDHLLRDVGLSRDRVQSGLVSRVCTTC